jgi:PKD repeat protein
MIKHLIYILLLLPVLFVASGCQKYEVGKPLPSTLADFTIDSMTNEGKAPCKLYFRNTSINANGYVWDFGNGQTSTEANPVASYDRTGLYTIKLTCTAVNDVYYNQLVKTMVFNTLPSQVLYFTTRGATSNVHYVLLDDPTHTVYDFSSANVTLDRPYGITADTANSKVYVSDYSINTIYRFDANGTNPLKILDGAVAGQEICQSPEGLMVVGNKLYWGAPGGIFRCDLDGKNPEIYNPNLEFPLDMQYDPKTNMVYLVNDHDSYSGGYFSLNFNGTNLKQPIADIDGTAIEVNTETGKVYIAGYADAGPAMPVNAIYMCNLDGTHLLKIGEYGTKATWGIGIDNKRGKLFWGVKNDNTKPNGKIIRANLDGSGQEDWVKNVNPNAMQVVWIKL